MTFIYCRLVKRAGKTQFWKVSDCCERRLITDWKWHAILNNAHSPKCRLIGGITILTPVVNLFPCVLLLSFVPSESPDETWGNYAGEGSVTHLGQVDRGAGPRSPQDPSCHQSLTFSLHGNGRPGVVAAGANKASATAMRPNWENSQFDLSVKSLRRIQ